ncbi:hypothetical protein B6S44_03125 [Bosea sp. Tri-44]|nr:hypothetical protein B6S44_03125 [Bosea sp. Tri-44]
MGSTGLIAAPLDLSRQLEHLAQNFDLHGLFSDKLFEPADTLSQFAEFAGMKSCWAQDDVRLDLPGGSPCMSSLMKFGI